MKTSNVTRSTKKIKPHPRNSPQNNTANESLPDDVWQFRGTADVLVSVSKLSSKVYELDRWGIFRTHSLCRVVQLGNT